MPVSSEELVKRPIFKAIEPDGGELIPLSPLELLYDLGAPSEFCYSVNEHTAPLVPLLNQGFATEVGDNDRICFEGRGVYHDCVLSDLPTTAYVLGVGSQSVIKKRGTDVPHPGFPDTSDYLMFDGVMGASAHPRVLGTETTSWGFLEYLNASVVLAQLATANGWTTIEEALDAGATVPIGLLQLPTLTSYIGNLLKERVEASVHASEHQHLSWKGNYDGLCTVGQLVPGCKRMPRVGRLLGTESDALNPTNYSNIGFTLRTLLTYGIIYSTESSHGQNVYQSDLGKLVYADNSDYVLLGDYTGTYINTVEDARSFVSEHRKHEVLISKMLGRKEGMIPPISPIADLDYTFEDYYNSQHAFLTELLGGIIEADRISELPYLYPLFSREIDLAISCLLATSLSSDKWNQSSNMRMASAVKYSIYGAVEELKGKIAANLTDVETEYISTLYDNADFGVDALIHFIVSGDDSLIKSHTVLGQKYTLLKHALQLPENDRDRVLQEFADFFHKRDYTFLYEDSTRDVLVEFEETPYQMLLDLLKDGRVEDVSMLLQILQFSNYIGYTQTSPNRPGEYLIHYFLHSLEAGADIADVYEQTCYWQQLRKFVDMGNSVWRLAIYSETLFPLSINKFATSNGLETPSVLASDVLGNYSVYPEMRKNLLNFFTLYAELFEKFVSSPNDNSRLALDNCVDSFIAVDAKFSILSILHDSRMALLLGVDNTELAQVYYMNARNHYDTLYPQLVALLSPFHISGPKTTRLKHLYSLAKYYEEQGYNRIADTYLKLTIDNI